MVFEVTSYCFKKVENFQNFFLQCLKSLIRKWDLLTGP